MRTTCQSLIEFSEWEKCESVFLLTISLKNLWPYEKEEKVDGGDISCLNAVE